MENYTFLNSSQITAADRQKLINMLESYFDTQHDPEQMQIDEEGGQWIRTEIPECGMMIKLGEEVVGSTLIMPCTLDLMQDFISCKINEAQLADKIRSEKIAYEKMQAIYLCSAFIAPEHRGKNLTATALIKSITSITPKNKSLPLFYWGYAQDKKLLTKIVAKIAATLGADMFVRKG